MPSLKMKTKTTTGCLNEKNGLQVCQKSSMISKNPPCRARVAQNAEEIGTHTQSSQDVSVHEKLHAQEVGGDEANHNELSREDVFQKQQLTVNDSATVDIMEPTPSTCPANIETIFSPIPETVDFFNNEGGDNLYVPLLDSEDSDDSSRNSCEVSEIYISDLLFSGSPSESNSLFDNKADTMFLRDYKCEESSLLCDLTEDHMLPFLENTFDIGRDHDGRQLEETIRDADNSSLHMAIHQLRPCNQESHIHMYTDPDYECFDPQIYIQNLSDHPNVASNLLPTKVPNEKQNTKRVTLVLDLDETLVHSTLDHCDDADFAIPVYFDMKEHTVYVKKRPHLQIFLKRVAEMFDIVVFTASQSIYAKQLLDVLDPEGKLISRRAYREACIFTEGIYTKDLTVLGVDLAKVAIIDNSPQVFRLQVNNGIPIKSWFDDSTDSALILLLPFLETLVDADDVRPIIAKKFGNKEQELLVCPF